MKQGAFADAQLRIGEIVWLFLCSFVERFSLKRIQDDTLIAASTVLRYRQIIFYGWLEEWYDSQGKLGMAGEIVEIDESHFSQRK